MAFVLILMLMTCCAGQSVRNAEETGTLTMELFVPKYWPLVSIMIYVLILWVSGSVRLPWRRIVRVIGAVVLVPGIFGTDSAVVIFPLALVPAYYIYQEFGWSGIMTLLFVMIILSLPLVLYLRMRNMECVELSKDNEGNGEK